MISGLMYATVPAFRCFVSTNVECLSLAIPKSATWALPSLCEEIRKDMVREKMPSTSANLVEKKDQ